MVIETLRNIDRESDPRAFAEISIGNVRIKGLLDTGASEAYLGVDFWKVFQLAPEVFRNEEINLERLQDEFKVSEHKTNPHILSDEQNRKLKEVIGQFPAFEKLGLGCTHMEKHTIKLTEGAVPLKIDTIPCHLRYRR
ncbi:hypothetical protein EVAR_70158_1 [Eumeta japonica]|uniref:Uncharacterized protein n=1 Tax=Eumeta variegata TaxID=151549 RepID=A0A4C1SBT7_EUMVA|nr:hypothetical protein EVAR_70158_1 [Eumeta japonica]